MSNQISDDEIAQVRENKSSLTKESILALDAALLSLQRSHRFGFFEMMELGHFSAPDGKALGVLKDLTFGKLIDEGTLEICMHRSMGPARVKRLTAIIEHLLEGEAPGETDERKSDLPDFVTGVIGQSSHKKDFRMKHLRKDVPVFGSVEAERRLSEGIARLRSAPDLKKFQHMKLAEYWDPTITSAPFIEDLTVAELAEINLDILLKKRSFGNRKIFALLQAIDTCLSRESGAVKSGEKGATVVDFRSAVESTRGPGAIHEKVIWQNAEVSLPSFSDGILLYVQRSVNEETAQLGSCRRLLRSIVREMLPEDFLSLWLLSEFGEDFNVSLIGYDKASRDMVVNRALAGLGPIVEAQCPVVLQQWTSMLQSAAVPEDKLFLTLSDSQLDDILVHAIGKMILLALEARPVEAFGFTLSGYWTKRPQSFELVLSTLVRGLPKKDEVLRHELSALLPFVLNEHLQPVLSIIADYDQKSGEWRPKIEKTT